MAGIITDVMVIDKEFNLLGCIDAYISLIYTRRWSSYGDIKLEVYQGQYNDILKKGNILIFNRCPEKNAEITGINPSDDHKIITGRSLLWWTSYRLTIPKTGSAYYTKSGSYPKIMTALVTDHMISPETAARKINNLKAVLWGTDPGGSISYEASYQQVNDELEELSEASEIGVSLVPDAVNKWFEYRVKVGNDRTILQSEHQPIIFNRDYGNLYGGEYNWSNLELKTTAVVGGSGEELDRTFYTIGGNYTGLDRREVFVDARSADDTELASKGEQQMANYKENETYVAETTADKYTCIEDGTVPEGYWDLGDKVTLIDNLEGIVMNARITEIEETVEKGIYTATPTLGFMSSTLLSAAANLARRRIDHV